MPGVCKHHIKLAYFFLLYSYFKYLCVLVVPIQDLIIFS